MKKSEKIKGKKAIAEKKKKQVRYGLMTVAGIAIIAVILIVLFNPFIAKTGDTVSVYYTGTLENGTIFDTNENSSPLNFTIGKGMVIPGFDEAVTGMSLNESKTIRIPSEKAYGSYNTSLVHTVNRSVFPANVTPVTGQFYGIKNMADGTISYVKIINVTSSTVTFDENHELAGENLIFTIRLVGINQK